MRSVVVTLISVFLLLGFAPASSAKVNNTADTTGDTMTYDVDRAIWVASPNNDQGDISAVRINNGKKAVTVRLTFVKLVPSAPTVRTAQYTVGLVTNEGISLQVIADMAQNLGNPVATNTNAGNRPVCSPKTTWAFGDNQVTFRFPNRCFKQVKPRAKHKRVWVSARSKIYTDRHDGIFHRIITDTAYRTGGSNEQWVLGPGVRR